MKRIKLIVMIMVLTSNAMANEIGNEVFTRQPCDSPYGDIGFDELHLSIIAATIELTEILNRRAEIVMSSQYTPDMNNDLQVLIGYTTYCQNEVNRILNSNSDHKAKQNRLMSNIQKYQRDYYLLLNKYAIYDCDENGVGIEDTETEYELLKLCIMINVYNKAYGHLIAN